MGMIEAADEDVLLYSRRAFRSKMRSANDEEPFEELGTGSDGAADAMDMNTKPRRTLAILFIDFVFTVS